MSFVQYLRFDIARRNKHKVVTLGYAFAITFAFILSLTNNNDVSASITPTERFDYLMLETNINNSISTSDTIYPENSIENIKSLFQMVNDFEREKTVENEIVVKKGDTLISVFTEIGLTRSEANDIHSKLRKSFDPRDLKIGQKLTVTKVIDTQTNALVELKQIVFPHGVGVRHIIEKNEKQQFVVNTEKDEIMTEVNNALGVINGTLSNSMAKQGIPRKVVSNFINIFSFSVDFRRDVRKGDKFEIVYENQITPNGEVVKTGNILYAALILKKEKISLYRFKDAKGNIEYYNEKGLAMKKTLHRKPLAFQNARISSPFGKRRHPIYRDLRIHWGVDYAAPRGTAVYAAGDGVVQAAKYNGGYGKYIKIRHNSEYSTAYGHLNGYAKGIRAGSRVKQGQVIGYVGNTGRSTGPHLHYEVIQAGRRVNPTTIKAATGENLQGKNLASFKKVVAELQQSHKKMFAKNEPVKKASK